MKVWACLPIIATGLFPTKSGNPFRSGEWVLGIKLVKKQVIINGIKQE
jgi:hypothetical protein